jgi:hypothetical protein
LLSLQAEAPQYPRLKSQQTATITRTQINDINNADETNYDTAAIRIPPSIALNDCCVLP